MLFITRLSSKEPMGSTWTLEFLLLHSSSPHITLHSLDASLSLSDDWKNFLERMKNQFSDEYLTEADLWEKDDAYELRLWASYRGQTLARTVRGMMYYERCVSIEVYINGNFYCLSSPIFLIDLNLVFLFLFLFSPSSASLV